MSTDAAGLAPDLKLSGADRVSLGKALHALDLLDDEDLSDVTFKAVEWFEQWLASRDALHPGEGRVVVDLPESDHLRAKDCAGWFVERDGNPQGRAAYAITATGDDGVPMVCAQTDGEPWKEIKGSSAEMRRGAAAILAACNRAELLAAGLVGHV